MPALALCSPLSDEHYDDLASAFESLRPAPAQAAANTAGLRLVPAALADDDNDAAQLRDDDADDPAPVPLAPKRGRRTSSKRRADTCESSQSPNDLITTEEAAEILRMSPKTLTNWRSQGKGPAHRKVGGRVVYRRAAVVGYGLECPGFGQQGKPEVSITIRPYAKDPTRSHVDVMFPHPLQPGQKYRKRIVAPAGMDPSAAKVWGEREAQDILYALIRGATPAPVDATPTAEREAPPSKSQRKPAPAPADEVPTLAEFWETFQTAHIDQQKLATRLIYRTAWKHIRPVLGEMRLDQIDRRAIARLRARMKAAKLAPVSRNTMVNKLVKALRVAIDDGVIPERDVTVKRETVPKVHKVVYTPVDVNRMLAVCETMQDTALVLLCYEGALRIGETAGLQWGDIDWSARTMTICRNVSVGVLQTSAKGETGIVPLAPRLYSALQRLHDRRADASPFVLRPGPRSRRPVEHVPEATPQDRICELQERAGLVVYGPHRLRHSALTHLASLGASPYALQALARHADLQTTMRYYVHLDGANTARQATALFGADDATPGPRGNAVAIDGNEAET